MKRLSKYHNTVDLTRHGCHKRGPLKAVCAALIVARVSSKALWDLWVKDSSHTIYKGKNANGRGKVKTSFEGQIAQSYQCFGDHDK